MRWGAAVSLLVHVVLGVLLLVTIPREKAEEWLPPPSPVTMLFESGRPQGPTLQEPTPETSVPSAPPVPDAPMPVPPMSRPPPMVPFEAAPPVEPASPVQTVPAPAAPPLDTAPPPPEALGPAPQVAVPPLPAPSPPPLPIPAKPPAPPVPTKPRPAPKRVAPPDPSAFPAPMDLSFGKPAAQARPPMQRHPAGSIDMSLGPAMRGAANVSPHADMDSEDGGPDWRNALSLWVAQHAYYPEQAREHGEEGDAKVHVVADRNGRVREVELVGKSGSMWLDLALQALFRNARIPPLPPGGTEPIDFGFTMHYILRRVPR